ncbi:MAG: AMIN domain-containing protein [Gemmatimonadaceae bacterium]|nr:AMIN domain-containing protein [Gemmatimonadaceae bacterium]
MTGFSQWRRAALLLAVAAAPLSAAPVPADSGRATGAVTSIRIVPGKQKAEVVIGTEGAVTPSDFTLAEPHRVIVDLQGAALQANPALYDKVARGGITNVRMAQYRPDVVRLVLEFDGPRPYTVQRTEREIRLAVDGPGDFAPWSSTGATPAAASPASASRRADATEAPLALAQRQQPMSDKPRISVTYVDADIRDVIAAFAAFSGRTIVVGRAVTGNVPYLDIKDKPWDIALRAVLESQGLAASEDASGIIRVDSYVNILARQASEPLETRSLRLNYASANALMPTVRSLLSRDCSPGSAQQGAAALQTGATGGQAAIPQGCIVRGSVMSDSLTNSLFITDVPSRLDDLQSFVRSLDIRTPQVAIKAKIILVNRRQIEDLGLRYDLSTRDNFFSQVVGRPDPLTLRPIDTNGDGVPDAVGGTPSVQNVFNVGGGQVAAIANAAARVANPSLSLMFSAALGQYDLTSFLDALSETALADVQAEPSIVTLNNRPAQIFAGDQIPFRQVDAGALTGGAAQPARAVTQLVDAGIRLAVTPQVSANRMITMTIRAENSSASQATSDGNPLINRQEATNQLLVADGETAVIGGLTVTTVQVVRTGIPYLKDLPLIGALFRRQSRSEEKRDLLLLITPHILDEGETANRNR